jgi:hypothetical protein
MNLAHKPPFLLLYHIHQSYFAAYIRLFNMPYDPTLGFAPLSPPPRMLKNTATQLRPAKSMPNLQHVRIPLGSPVHTVADDNTASHHSSHSSIIVPLISVTSPVDSSSLEHLPVEYCLQKTFHCDSEYIPAIAMSPHHFTCSGELPIWKLQSLGPFGVRSHSEKIQLSIGSLIRLFDEELGQYTLGFEKHILCGRLVKALRREPGIQIYQMGVDRFTVTAAQIAVEQATAYVAIPYYFISTSGLISEISPCSLGQVVGSEGQVIFPARRWTHPLKAEIDCWYQQQRREKGEDVKYIQEGH